MSMAKDRGRTGLMVATTFVVLTLVTPAARQPQPPASTPFSEEKDRSRVAFVIQELSTRYHFETDGRGSKEVSFSVKIQSDLGVRQWGQLAFLYASALEDITVALLEVRKADGTLVQPGASAVTDAAVQPGADSNMFQDLRQLHLTVPSLNVGDTLATRLVWRVHSPPIRGRIFVNHDFNREAIVLDEQLAIDLPASLKATINVAADAPAEGSGLHGRIEGDRRVFHWKTSNLRISGSEEESAAADDEEDEAKPPAVRVTSFESWAQVSDWYHGLAMPALIVNDAIRAKAEELTKGLRTDDERMRAVYDFVSNHIRYVSRSFGVGRFAPHEAPEVLANEYGDCKDKHTLLAALLKSIGIEAWPVLASHLRSIDAGMPSPAEFDHLLTVVPRGKSPADWIWLDTTSGLAPYGMLIRPLRDRAVLVVTPAGSKSPWASERIRRTPASVPFVPSRTIEIEGTINSVGVLSGKVLLRVRGDEEILLRSFLLGVPPERQLEAAKGMAHGLGLGTEVSDFKIVNLASRDPLTCEFTVRSTGLFEWTNTGATMKVPLPKIRLPFDSEDDWKKRSRARFGLPGEATVRATLVIPSSYNARVPVGITLTRDAFDFASSYRVEGTRMIAQRSIRLKQPEIPAATAAEYLAWVRAVRADEAQKIELTFQVAGMPEIPSDATAAELYAIGHATYGHKNYTAAAAFFRRAIELDPKHKDGWDGLGLALEQLGKREEAVEAFQKQTEVSPFHTQAFSDLARVLRAAGKNADAQQALAKHVEIAPLDGTALTDLGSWEFDAGEYKEAVSHLERATGLSRGDAWSYAKLGAAHAALGNGPKARMAMEEALKIASTPPIRIFLGWQLAQHRLELTWAEELAKTGLVAAGEALNVASLAGLTDTHTDLVQRVGWAWDALGWIDFQKGSPAAAARYLRAAWTVLGSPAMMERLGQVKEKQGLLVEAGSSYLVALGQGVTSEATVTRVRRIVGKDTDLSKLSAVAPLTAMQEHSLTITPGSALTANAQVTLLIDASGNVLESAFDSGDEAVRPLLTLMNGANIRFVFPDQTIKRLPVRAQVGCDRSTPKCVVVILPGLIAGTTSLGTR